MSVTNHSYNCIGITTAVGGAMYWVVLTLSNQVTPLILGSSLGLFGLFYIIMGVDVFAFFLVLLALPETKVESILASYKPLIEGPPRRGQPL